MTKHHIVRSGDIPYRTVDGHTLLLDIIRPDPLPHGPMPIVLYLFGGAWMENNRTTEEQNRNAFLAAQGGLFTVGIDYRLSSQALFPAQIAGARAAVRWLRAHAHEYNADPGRIGVWGYSSGAHLAALLGTAADVPALDDTPDAGMPSCRVQAVATIAAPTDFLQMGGWYDEYMLVLMQALYG